MDKGTDLTPLVGVPALLTAVPLVARRRFPLGVLAIELPLLMTCLAVFHPNKAAVAITMLLVFTVGLEGGRARSLVVGALMALVVTAAVFITGERAVLSDVIAYASLVLGALLAGEALRARQALQHALAEEAAHAREAAAQHRFDQERLALAHELHDVIGHTLVAINMRASAAAHRERKSANADGAAALADGPTPLDEIASASAGALTELRTALKALRGGQNEPAPLHPFQDLANLGGLISGVEDAGLSVELEVAGAPLALPATVGHAGYRIVQEGLTNVLRHSTARQARVRVEVGGHAVVIEAYVSGQQAASPAGFPLSSTLTAREVEILRLIAAGRTNTEIAEHLFISPLTCKSHVSRILMKLDARDRIQLVVLAYESGLVVPGQTSGLPGVPPPS